MRLLALALAGAVALTACTLTACSKPPQTGEGAGAPAAKLKLGPKDGAWSEREALEGPMALWGPPGLGKEAVALTCLPKPRQGLVVTLFSPAASTDMAQGTLVLRIDGKGVGVPLTPKDEGAFEARLPASDALMRSLDGAKEIRFEVKGVTGAGIDAGPATDPLKRVLAACR